MNAYLVTPPLSLEAGHTYRVSYSARISSTNKGLDVLLGTGTDVESLSINLLTHTLDSKTAQPFDIDFTVETSGVYYLALHAYDVLSANSNDIYVSNFKIFELTEAPKAVTDLSVTPGADGAMTATISWTNPTELNTNAPLSSLTRVDIYRGEDLIGSVSEGLVPGETASFVDTAVPSAGKHDYSAIAYSSAASEKASVTSPWIGADTRCVAIPSVTAAADGDDSIVISWTAPSGYNGGYLDPEVLSYTIRRTSNGKTEIIATDVKETRYTDNTLSGLASYVYTVQPIYGEYSPASTAAAAVICGGTATLPYSQDFSNDDSLELLALFHGENGTRNWDRYTYQNNYRLRYWSRPADAYAVCPVFALEAGKAYKVSCRAAVGKEEEDFSIAILLGQEATAEGLDNVLSDTKIVSKDYVELSTIFGVETSGRYYIAFHAHGEGGMNDVYLKDLSVSEVAVAPLAVTDLTATAGDEGALTVALSMTLPSKTNADTDIAALDGLTITRNGETIITITEGLTPGAEFTYTDAIPCGGEYTYSVTANIGENISDATVAKVDWAGPDAPKPVTNAIATVTYDQEGEPFVTITFDAVTESVHGGFFNPEDVTYTITRLPDNITIAVEITETELNDPGCAELSMGRYSYRIVPQYINTDGEPVTTNTILIGNTVSLPYEPNFDSADDFEYWTYEADQDKNWAYNATNKSLAVTMQSDKYPWVFTPAFKAVAGEYKLETAFKTYSGTRPETVEIYLCAEPSSANQSNILLADETFKTAVTENHDYTFNIEKGGRYHIGYHLTTKDNWGCHLQKSNIYMVKAIDSVEGILAEGEFGLYYDPALATVGVSTCAATVEVVALDGRTVARADLQAGEELSIAHLIGGTYIVRATGNASASVLKILK